MQGEDEPRALRERVVEALLDAWAVLQPVECAGCARPDRGVCRACRAALAGAPSVRRVAGLPVPVVAAGEYGGVRRRLLLAGKERGREDALRALAPSLGAAIDAAVTGLPEAVELAWVPSTRAALRRRGFDPVLVMLRAARLPASRVLVARSGVAQKSLSRSARLAAAPDRLRAVGALEGRRFVLVDDVVTTGATARAAATAIADGGGEVVSAACLGIVDRLAANPR